MKAILIILISVLLSGVALPAKNAPVKQPINILKVDTPLKVSITPNQGRDTVYIEGIPMFKMANEKTWWERNAPLVGIIGVLLGFSLNWIRDYFFKKDDRKRVIIDDLTIHKIKAAKIIPDFRDHALEKISASRQIKIGKSMIGKTTLGGSMKRGVEIDHAKEVEKYEAKLFYHSNKLTDALTEFREQVGYYERYLGNNIMFGEMVERLNNFDVSEIEVDEVNDKEVIDQKNIVLGIRTFVDSILQRFIDLMDIYLNEYSATSEKNMKEFELNVYFVEDKEIGGYFTTKAPKENPKGVIKEQEKINKNEA